MFSKLDFRQRFKKLKRKSRSCFDIPYFMILVFKTDWSVGRQGRDGVCTIVWKRFIKYYFCIIFSFYSLKHIGKYQYIK